MRTPHPELARCVVEALGEIDRTAEYLATEESEALHRGFGAEFAEREIVGNAEDLAALQLHQRNWIERRRALLAGAKGLALIAQKGEDVPLAEDEVLGLKVILAITARPAILFLGGRLVEPPKMWAAKLAAIQDQVRVASAAVGRIEVGGNAIGTGFLAGEGLALTNRHVTRSLGAGAAVIALTPSRQPQPRRFSVTETVFEHPALDLAVIRVAPRDEGGTETLPPPLCLSRTAPVPSHSRDVYVVGFPHRPPQNYMSAEIMDRLFARVYGVQRVQPGAMVATDANEGVFTHDCSTLGGNSGSPVIDMRQGTPVLGLHFGGEQLRANRAVALWHVHARGELPELGLNWA